MTVLWNHAVLTRLGRGKLVQITRVQQFRGARSLAVLHMSISLVNLQINPYRPSPSHSATDSQSFPFSVKILSWSTLSFWGGGGQGSSQEMLVQYCSATPSVPQPNLSLSRFLSVIHNTPLPLHLHK
jgi:hypothetical protein